MNIFEYYQNQRPAAEHFVPRKCHLVAGDDINLYGVRGSGKTSLVLDYLSMHQDDEVLYIDMDDPNLVFAALEVAVLQRYIDKNHINILVLDHYADGTLPKFPNVGQLIILTRTPIKSGYFKYMELFPLDYEEFLAFESSSLQHKGFNNFLRLGTLPLLARSQKNSTHAMKWFFQSSFDSKEQKLLMLLAQHHTKHLTTHQIYSFAKEKFKISKDWLYRKIKAFQDEKLVLFIDDRYQKSGKKMLLFDFAFAKYLTLGQPFIHQFDTMIALTLIRHHIDVKTLGIHGYITKNYELIIPAPFESEESLWVKSQNKFGLYKKYSIKKVTVITVTNHYNFSIEKLHFEALPFHEWSIAHTESEE